MAFFYVLKNLKFENLGDIGWWKRFEGENFMIELSHDELLRCQIGTSSWSRFIQPKEDEEDVK